MVLENIRVMNPFPLWDGKMAMWDYSIILFYFVLIRLVFSVEISKLKSPDIAGVSSEYMIAYLREFYEKYEEKKNSSGDAGSITVASYDWMTSSSSSSSSSSATSSASSASSTGIQEKEHTMVITNGKKKP